MCACQHWEHREEALQGSFFFREELQGWAGTDLSCLAPPDKRAARRQRGHRSVLFGVGCGITKCPAEHFHPLASPMYTYFPVCLGYGAVSCPLGLPSVISGPSACQSLWAVVLHHPHEASCHPRNNLPELCYPSQLPVAWPSLKEHQFGGAKLLPVSGKCICGPTRELLYSGSRAVIYRCLSQTCSRIS